jgi:hypothetical protein
VPRRCRRSRTRSNLRRHRCGSPAGTSRRNTASAATEQRLCVIFSPPQRSAASTSDCWGGAARRSRSSIRTEARRSRWRGRSGATPVSRSPWIRRKDRCTATTRRSRSSTAALPSWAVSTSRRTAAIASTRMNTHRANRSAGTTRHHGFAVRRSRTSRRTFGCAGMRSRARNCPRQASPLREETSSSRSSARFPRRSTHASPAASSGSSRRTWARSVRRSASSISRTSSCGHRARHGAGGQAAQPARR